MSEPPRRRPPTQEVPVGPRAVAASSRPGAAAKPEPDATVRNQRVNLADAPDEPTRTMSAEESAQLGRAKFAAPNDPNLKTTILQSGSARDARPTSPQPFAAAQPPARDTMQRETVQREAAGGSAMPAIDASSGDGPTGEHQRAKVWVAVHKPPPDLDPRLILIREPDSPRAASFRVLRHRLEERAAPRVIAVTSAERHEGKTTCAVNLALALGECGRARVLLVEANLRAPALAALFGFLPPECFAQQLERHRERPLDPWSVVEVFSPSLHVAAVKPGPENENRPLLDGVAVGIAMDSLRRAGYDYVVLDTPPVLGSADVNLIEDHADGVLLTAWSRESSSRALRRALEQLSPAKILGLTLLDV